MTISSNDRRKPYVGNGVADTFNGPRAFAASHVQVFTGEHPVYNLIPNSQYTITGVGGAATRVKFNTPPANGLDILLLRTVPYSQDTDITNQGAFNPEIHENAFDMRVMQIQQLADGSIQMVFEDGEFVWDAKGSRLVRLGNAIALTDGLNVQSALALIEQIQTGGGVVGVEPQFWDWEGDGATTDIPIPGANVANPYFYDTSVEVVSGSGEYFAAKPGVDFVPVIADDPDDSVLRFTTAPAGGVRGFTVLRGYARPYIGPQPVTTLALSVATLTASTLVDGTRQHTLLVVDSAVDVTISIRENTGDPDLDWGDGEYFSVFQLGVGKVNIALEDSGTLSVPADFLAQTRGQRSTVTACCRAGSTNLWTLSGDLLRQATEPAKQMFRLADRSVLIATNIAAGTGKDSFQTPYDIQLDAIADRGVEGTLEVAQSAGSIFTFDIKIGTAGGTMTSIFQTLPTIDNGEWSTTTAATRAVYSAAFTTANRVIPAGTLVRLDVTQIGTALAKGLSAVLRGQRAG